MQRTTIHPAVTLAALAFCVAGCGGSKVLKEPQPMLVTQSLAVAADQQLAGTVEWVIVRDGPGTWAKNADWDQYILTLQNRAGEPVSIDKVVVVDSMGAPLESLGDRKALVKGSKQTARRYKGQGVEVKAGAGAGTMIVAGTGLVVVAAGAATAAAYGAVLGSATSATAGAAAAASGLVLLGPALVVGGIIRGANNGEVNREIAHRQTELPLQIPAGESAGVVAFFPLAPSPLQVEVSYSDASGNHVLAIDVRESLDGLHIDAR